MEMKQEGNSICLFFFNVAAILNNSKPIAVVKTWNWFNKELGYF